MDPGRAHPERRPPGPPLLRYELGNALYRLVRSRITDLGPDEREAIIERSLLGFRFVDSAGASRFAPPLTYYDAAYLAVAKSRGAVLVTYDTRRMEAAGEAGVAVLTPQ